MTVETQSKPATSYQKVAAIITDEVIKLIEQHQALMWEKPWKPGMRPRSVHGHVYRGINAFLLSFEDYPDPRYITFKEATRRLRADAKGKPAIKKGSKSHIVTYAGVKIIKDKDEPENEKKQKKIPFLRYYRVFNVSACTDDVVIPALPAFEEFDPIERAEEIIAEYVDGPRTIENEGEAYYLPSIDEINMPRRERFNAPADFYATLFHEQIHSTGHKSRLDRDLSGKFDKGSYSREELIAEMGAAFLCGEAGIDTPKMYERHANYLASWLQALKNDPQMLVWAAGRAQKAADHILNISFSIQPEKDEN